MLVVHLTARATQQRPLKEEDPYVICLDLCRTANAPPALTGPDSTLLYVLYSLHPKPTVHQAIPETKKWITTTRIQTGQTAFNRTNRHGHQSHRTVHKIF